MLNKQITRRRKKYIFLDFLILEAASIYFRIRIIDTQFYDSLQPQYLWMITALLALFHAKIGRILSLLLFMVINFACLQFMGRSIILFTSIYRITQQSIFILIVSIILHNWKDLYYRLLIQVMAMGSLMEIINMFYPLITVKYAALVTVLILGCIKVALTKTPKVEYMRLLTFPFNSKVLYVLLVYFVMLQVAFVDWIGLFNMMVSSQWRFVHIFTFLTTAESLIVTDYYMKQSFIYVMFGNSILLLIDNFFAVWFAAFYVPVATFYLMRYFPKMKELMHSRVPNAQKHRNYDIIVILAFCIYHTNYWIGEHYTFHMSHIYPSLFAGAVLLIGLTRSPRRIEAIREKLCGKRPPAPKYDEFQSAKNDDTVL